MHWRCLRQLYLAQLDPSILKPNLHLRLVQVQLVGQVNAVLAHQVHLFLKLKLQSLELLGSEDGPDAFGFVASARFTLPLARLAALAALSGL